MNEAQPSVLSAAWRHRWLVLVIAAFVVAIALIIDLLGPDVEVYEASSAVVIQEPAASVEVAVQGSSLQFIRSQLEIMGSPVVSEEAAAIVNEGGGEVTSDEVAESVFIFGTADSPLVLITAQAETPELAVMYVNAMAEGYRQVSQRQASATSDAQLARIDAQVGAIDDRLAEIDEELTGLIANNPSLENLREQAQAAVSEIARIQVALLAAEGEEANVLRQQLEDNRATLTVYQEVLDATAAGPEQQALNQEQSLQIERRARLLILRDEVAVDAGMVPDAVALVQPATSAERIGGLGLSRILAGALIVGLALGVALAYVLSTWRKVFVGRSEPAAVLGVPMLADVPDFELENLASAVPVRDAPRSAAAEAYRFAASSTEASARTRGIHTVFVASSTLGHGKTTTVVNTSLAAAFQGRSVLLMDCDFGNQEATRLLLGPTHGDTAGMTEIIDGMMSFREAIHTIDLGNGRSLSLLSRGTRPGLAGAALQSKAAAELFADLREEFDLVLIDGPPLLQVAYASTLAELAEGVVVVIEHQGRRSHAEDLMHRMELIGTPVLGYIYNRSALRREMTMTEGSMMDILGDAAFDIESEAEPAERPG